MKAEQSQYSWSRPWGISAQDFGEWISNLTILDAEHMLAEARNPKCVAHALFNWDDTDAARRYRAYQANMIVNSLQIRINDANQKPQIVQAYIRSVRRKMYVPTRDAEPEDLSMAEQRCWREMQKFRHRNANIRLARSVIEAIAAVEHEVVKRRKKA